MTITVLFFAWLYLPIVAVVLFSFNSEVALRPSRASASAGTTTSSTTTPLLTVALGQPRDRGIASVGCAHPRHHARVSASSASARGAAGDRRGDAAAAGHPRDRHRRRRAAVLHRARHEALAVDGHPRPRSPSRSPTSPLSCAAGSAMSPRGRGGRPRPRRDAVAGGPPGHPARRSARRSSALGLLVFALVFDDFVRRPSSPRASTRSRCRCGSTPRSGSASRRRSTPSAP